MPHSSLRMVLLPAPLCPTMPSASPVRTSKLAFRSAQLSAGRRPRNPRAGHRRLRASGVWCATKYRLETESNLTSTMMTRRRSDEVGHERFGRFEVAVAYDEADKTDRERRQEELEVGRAAVQHGLAEGLNQASDRIHENDALKPNRNGTEWIDHWRCEHPDLQEQRQAD